MKCTTYIKIGGSLVNNIEQLKALLEKIIDIFGTDILVNVGSGRLGDEYKKWIYNDNNYVPKMSISVQNWALIQLINANIICSLNDSFRLCFNEQDIVNNQNEKKACIIDTSSFEEQMASLNLFTSDLKAIYLSNLFDSNETIIFTNVNGVYTADPKSDIDAKFLSRIFTSELKTMGRTSLDDGVAELLEQYNKSCRVIGIDDFLSERIKDFADVSRCGTLVGPNV